MPISPLPANQASPFQLHQPFQAAGDQPDAIVRLFEGLNDGLAFQTLLGVTGSGKTFTMANVIAQIGAPTLILAPNKTLAAQLYSEMREFFPNNAVEYFVSYYDYYQPEAAVGHQVAAGAPRCGDRRHRVGDLRHRRPERLPLDDPGAAAPRPDRPARHHRAAGGDAVPSQRERLRARHLSRTRGHDRRVSGRACGSSGAHRAARRRDRDHPAVRPAHGSRAAEGAALHHLSVLALRDAAPDGAAGD